MRVADAVGVLGFALVAMHVDVRASSLTDADLNCDQIIPRSSSSSQLLTNIKANDAVLRRSASLLAIAPNRYARVRKFIDLQRPWSALPRHIHVLVHSKQFGAVPCMSFATRQSHLVNGFRGS